MSNPLFDIKDYCEKQILETGTTINLSMPGHGVDFVYLLPPQEIIDMGAIDEIMRTPMHDANKAAGVIHEDGKIIKGAKWVALEDAGIKIDYKGQMPQYFNKHVAIVMPSKEFALITDPDLDQEEEKSNDLYAGDHERDVIEKPKQPELTSEMTAYLNAL